MTRRYALSVPNLGERRRTAPLSCPRQLSARPSRHSGDVDLMTLDAVVGERAGGWAARGAAWEIIHGPATANPAAWVVLTLGDSVGQLTLWATGEAQLDWGDRATGGAGHYDLASRDDLDAALDVLEIELGIE